ncbi:MAG: ATP-grasp domain-containing protein [Bacteriovoracaceae bacterium]|jgi:predicted ATP-grasp superfamily ATP-dependent carboligase|nr:ATP-grasp domain-containing protein [Bacteriovoracaceae bacterium]
MNILITNSRAPGALELARILSDASYRVFSIESFPVSLCEKSKSVIKEYKAPKPRFESVEYIEMINKICNKESIDLIIPCFEESFFVSKYRDQITCKNIFVDDIKKMKRLHNKYEFIDLCLQLNLDVPRTYLVESDVDFYRLEIDSKDFVFKPCFSRYGEDVLISPKKYTHQKGQWVCQKRLYGKSYCSYAVCVEGNVKALSIYPVEETYGKVCISFKQINEHDKNYKLIKEWILKFVEKTKYTGQIGFDFIVDTKAYAIECNPRMTSGIHLFKDESRFHSSFFSSSKEKLLEPKTKEVVSMKLLLLMPGKKFFKHFFKILNSRDVIWNKNDIKPFFSQFIIFLYLVYLSFKYRITISAASSYDIEWNGE